MTIRIVRMTTGNSRLPVVLLFLVFIALTVFVLLPIIGVVLVAGFSFAALGALSWGMRRLLGQAREVQKGPPGSGFGSSFSSKPFSGDVLDVEVIRTDDSASRPAELPSCHLD